MTAIFESWDVGPNAQMWCNQNGVFTPWPPNFVEHFLSDLHSAVARWRHTLNHIPVIRFFCCSMYITDCIPQCMAP